MATAYLANDNSHIEIETVWIEKELIQQIPGASWDKCRNRRWCVPLSWASCVILRGIFKNNLQVSSRLNDWGWQERQARIQPAMNIRNIIELSTDEIPEWYKTGEFNHLYPFQITGVEFLLRAGHALLADDPGTGKTIQALTALKICGLEALPAIVICPNSVKINWTKEIEKWYPEATPYPLIGNVPTRRKILNQSEHDPNAIVIINYEAIRAWSRMAPYGSIKLRRCKQCDSKYGEELKSNQCEVHPKELNYMKFKTAILDEAHRITNPKSKQTRAAWFAMHNPSINRRWALTGTPILSHPGQIWGIMHAIVPNEYPTKSKFIDRYCLSAWNNFGGLDIVGIRPDTKEEFFQFFDPRARRMPKSLVLKQLPNKIRSTRYVEMTSKQLKAYKEIEENMLTVLEGGDLLVTPSNLSAASRLLQFASSYAKIERPDPQDLDNWRVVLREPSPKIDELEVLITEDLKNKKVVVCAPSKQLIELATQRLIKLKIPVVQIVGGMATWERDISLNEFQHGDAQVLLFTTQAGGVGLTMTAADTLIRLQRSWSMADELQAEDRVHRIGSEIHNSIYIIDIVTNNTIETKRQLPNLQAKWRRLEEITRSKEVFAANGEDFTHLEAEEAQIFNSYLL